MPFELWLEPDAKTAKILRRLIGEEENVAQIIAEAIIEELKDSPRIPASPDSDLRKGWRVTEATKSVYYHSAVASNPDVVVAPEESWRGPRPFDRGIGVEYGHDKDTGGHWVAFAPKRLGRKRREKLIAWARAHGEENVKRFDAGDENAAMFIPKYEPHPFLKPKLEEFRNPAKIEQVLREYLEGRG